MEIERIMKIAFLRLSGNLKRKSPILEILDFLSQLSNITRAYPKVEKDLILKSSTGKVFSFPVRVSPFFLRIFSSFHSVILLSATFSPYFLYQRLLGLHKIDKPVSRVSIKSFFHNIRLKTFFITGVSTAFKYRSRTLFEKISQSLIVIFKKFCKRGILVFCPSRDIERIIFDLISIHLRDNVKRERQIVGLLSTGTSKQFISNVKPLILATIGGPFSEGIDFPFLDCVCIVGIPFPPPSLKEHFRQNLLLNELQLSKRKTRYLGYVIPTINKSIHAIGRLTRPPNTSVNVFLIDQRYLRREYLKILPYWLTKDRRVLHINDLLKMV